MKRSPVGSKSTSQHARRAKSPKPASPERGDIIRTRTLEELWEVLTKEGPAKAQRRLEEYLPAAAAWSFAVNDPDPAAQRRQGPLHYRSYGPPSWFEAPYIVLQVSVTENITNFMTHGGEEILFNLEGDESGEITYEFFWPDGTPRLWESEALVRPGEAIRINPSLLHRNRRSGSPKAWLILRPTSDSPASLFVHDHPDVGNRAARTDATRKASKDRVLREFTPEELAQKKRGQLLLIESGLLEKLRVRRLRSELSVQEVARLCRLNKYYVARLERLELENVPVDNVYEIAKQIDVDLMDLLSPFNWAWKRYLIKDRVDQRLPLARPKALGRHYLHAALLHVSAGQQLSLETSGTREDIASWVVLRGQMIPLITGVDNPPLVKSGHVLHARNGLRFDVQALLGDVDLLEIKYSADCTCGESQQEEAGEYVGIKQEGPQETGR